MSTHTTQRKSEIMQPENGLFSHPDVDLPDTTPGSSPAEDQRSYTGLFREPADTPQNTTGTA
ncbi:hypothetical protein SAMN05660733_00264 [Lentzea albidocapillata]|uniref:Uncharacterized protein n=1 Tax=Lentzea albidocapillata TaxID=40571 RepID=A0A1W1ZWC3_9PSEU|nr:hypothetical protein SAMN05660733_00264 [Lentzea albidocapillata]